MKSGYEAQGVKRFLIL